MPYPPHTKHNPPTTTHTHAHASPVCGSQCGSTLRLPDTWPRGSSSLKSLMVSGYDVERKSPPCARTHTNKQTNLLSAPCCISPSPHIDRDPRNVRETVAPRNGSGGCSCNIPATVCRGLLPELAGVLGHSCPCPPTLPWWQFHRHFLQLMSYIQSQTMDVFSQ